MRAYCGFPTATAKLAAACAPFASTGSACRNAVAAPPHDLAVLRGAIPARDANPPELAMVSSPVPRFYPYAVA